MAYGLIFVSRDINQVLVCYLVVGLTGGGRCGVGINYMSEFLPQKSQSFAICFCNTGDALVMVMQAIYYSQLRDWQPLHSFQLAFCAVILVLILRIPESPKFYYTQKRFNEARIVLKEVAWMNGKMRAEEVDGIVFDTEVDSNIQYLDQSGNQLDISLNITLIEADTSKNDHEEVIKLEGKQSEIFRIWQLRTNFFLLAFILTSSSFCYFLINF